MQQHWARVTREIENGTYRRDVARAAARFGEKEALTILGKKKQKQYAVLAEAQLAARAKRRGVGGGDELELADSDLLVDDDDDDVPTGSSQRVPISADDPGSSERKGQLSGLRWTGKNAGDPVSAVRTAEQQTGVKRRLAELAAAMKVPVPTSNDDPGTPPPRAPSPPAIGSGVRPEVPGFGALDLDFDDAANSQRSALPRKPGAPAAPIASAAIPGPVGARPLPPGARPLPPMRPPAPSDVAGPRTPAPFSPRTPPPQAPPPRASGPEFGSLDLPFEPPPPVAPPRRPLPLPAVPPRAAAPPRPTASAAPPRAPAAPVAGPPPPAPAIAQRSAAPPPRPAVPVARPAAPAAESPLPDQRVRQIYEKYVEAKRSANESTAGVTYEKLAETLRAQASRLKATHPAKSVDYDVVIKDGKALLKPVLR
ncbi:MAG: MXAN_5187 C-terminal domain-containing protein, partial [Byssovorax sp.]